MINYKLLNPFYYRSCARLIFSKTGRWDPEVSLETKVEIEQHWQDAVARINEKESSRSSKLYVLAMFPYPSGNLHMGHARVYTISDTIARFHRMNGRHVIHPMGWDAFGLPAENAARDRGVDPAVWTRDNISAMRGQLSRLGLCLDWTREVDTSSPQYYTGTQRIFLELWRAGLVYQDQALVNWDPIDQTVLAEEQVDSQGLSWRSGAKVEKRLLTQWFIRTTRFARKLLEGLDSPLLENWRDIIQLQKHWIGPCDGTHLMFPVTTNQHSQLRVWSSSPGECGVFVAVSHAHPLHVRENLAETQPFPEVALILKLRATNPLFGVELPVIVISKEENSRDDCGYLGVASRPEDCELAVQLGLSTESASISREEALSTARKMGVGGDETSSHLRDWLISRQRRWGTPIPLVHCRGGCGVVPVPDTELPVTLPTAGESLQTWKHTACPKCGGSADRETDTMDTFVDSSWYFLRFLDPQNSDKPFDPDRVKHLMPVDIYVGGKEHAVLHLYYARFMGHFLHSLGWLPEPEPFRRLLVQGMVMGKTYQLQVSGKYLPPDQVDTSGPSPKAKEGGEAVVEGWEKMSKSKYNGVDPGEVVDELGCDAARLLLLADVAPTSHRKWSKDTYPGILNWQHRLWLTVGKLVSLRHQLASLHGCPVTSGADRDKEDLQELLESEDARLWDARNFYVCGATFNYSHSQQLSVAVTRMQGLTGSLRKTPESVLARSVQFERALAAQLVMLAPMAPHFASELWAGFTSVRPMLSDEYDWNKPVLQQHWPQLDKEYMLNCLIKVNHEDVKYVKVPQSSLAMSEAQALSLALAQHAVYQAMGHQKLLRAVVEARPNYDLTIHLFTAQPEDGEKHRINKKKHKTIKAPR